MANASSPTFLARSLDTTTCLAMSFVCSANEPRRWTASDFDTWSTVASCSIREAQTCKVPAGMSRICLARVTL